MKTLAIEWRKIFRNGEKNREETIQITENITGSKIEESQNKTEEKIQTLRSIVRDEFQVTDDKIET